MEELSTAVLIIGAGSAGLLLAQGLKTAGIAFQIYERHSQSYESREWGMSLHWGGEFLAKGLPAEIVSRLPEIDTDPHYDSSRDGGYMMCNGETAETLVVMPGVMPRRVSRRKLNALLSTGLDIQYDKKLDSLDIDESSGIVRATFQDGSTATAKALVGCDGSRSKVRSIMLNDEKLSEPYDAGCTILNFPSSYSPEVSQQLRAVHPVMKVAYHPQLNMMYLLAILDGSSPKPEDWTYQHVISWAGSPTPAELTTPESRLEQLRKIGGPFADPWKLAAESVTDGKIINADRGNSWDPRSVFKFEGADGSTWNGTQWHGLVTLAGDAAHTMLPHRGQGLNNALEDASRLVKALTAALKDNSSDLSGAITAYEAEMVQRGGAEVEMTFKQSKASHNWNMLMQSPMFKHGANKPK